MAAGSQEQQQDIGRGLYLLNSCAVQPRKSGSVACWEGGNFQPATSLDFQGIGVGVGEVEIMGSTCSSISVTTLRVYSRVWEILEIATHGGVSVPGVTLRLQAR